MPSHVSLPVFQTALRVLTFGATREELLSFDHRHLAFGLLSTWIVGVGRYWDAPYPTLLERLGAGSLLFVFAFSLLVWLLVLPLKPHNGSYQRLLTFLALMSPPGLLYAIPVERMFDPATAQSMNVCFLGLVSVWRVSLLGFYFGRLVGLPRGAAVVATLIPVLSVIIGLAAVDVQHRVFSEMATLPPDSDGPVAFAWAIEVMTRSVIVLFTPLLAVYFLLGRARWAQC